MAGEIVAVRESTAMRLASAALGTPLGVFIAARRVPGAGWRKWAEVAADMERETGVEVTAETIRQWALTYGIPTDTGNTPQRSSDGDAYLAAVRALGIDI